MRTGEANHWVIGIMVAMPLCTAKFRWRGVGVEPMTTTPPVAAGVKACMGMPIMLAAEPEAVS